MISPQCGQPTKGLGLDRHLSHQDLVSCLEIIHRSLDCTGREGFSVLLGEIGGLIDADYSACLMRIQRVPEAAERILIMDGTFPAPWLALYAERQFHRIDPIVAENFSQFGLQCWSDTYLKSPPPRSFCSLAEDCGLRTGFSYGLQETGRGGSLFSFSGPRLKRCARNAVIQDLVLPHLHRALCQMDAAAPVRMTAVSLSARELEVLKWISAGKSSWDVGMILQISERTVNFHIRNIVRKLEVVNRPQAVAMALKLGLLELP